MLAELANVPAYWVHVMRVTNLPRVSTRRRLQQVAVQGIEVEASVATADHVATEAALAAAEADGTLAERLQPLGLVPLKDSLVLGQVSAAGCGRASAEGITSSRVWALGAEFRNTSKPINRGRWNNSTLRDAVSNDCICFLCRMLPLSPHHHNPHLLRPALLVAPAAVQPPWLAQ